MAKLIGKDPNDKNKWIDKNNGNQEFKGHVTKDLIVGDQWEKTNLDGSVKAHQVTAKYTTADGLLVVESISV